MTSVSDDEREGRYRYGAALALTFAAYILDAWDKTAVDLLVALVFVGILGLLIFDRRTPRVLKTIGLVAAGVSVVTSLVASLGDAGDGYEAVSQFTNLIVLAVALAALLAGIGFLEEITIATVMGAVMAYAFLAFVAAALYRGIDLVTDEPYFAQGAVERSDYSYFSFVAMTTLGFGDLTPGTDLAKRLVVLETFVGQVFLVVLVARLVSKWTPRPRRRAATPDES